MPQIISFQRDKQLQLTSLPPLSLYIHIPWCVEKCPYCDFNSHQIKNNSLPEDTYIDALLCDLQQELADVWGRSIHSIFIGGGTPGLFQPAAIDRLLNGIRALLPLEPDLEITLETNPGVFEIERFQGFRAAGINRLSIGVQSFNDHHLQLLGRIHNSDEAKRAIATALTIFPRVNIDLMYALPTQSIAQAQADIAYAISTGVSHISAYQLTLEPNTRFGHSPPRHLPDDDLLYDIESTVHQALLDQQFERYEISAFAKNRAYSQHNLNYWQFGDYIGIGAGAHGKISLHDKIIRTTKARNPKDYLQLFSSATPLAQNRYNRLAVNSKELPFEFMLNVLRLLHGVPLSYFTLRTGLPFSVISKQIQYAQQQNWLSLDNNQLKATDLGINFLNDLLTLFLQ